MFLPMFVLFLFLWTVVARWVTNRIWKTTEAVQKDAWQRYDAPKNHRWFMGERWNAKELAVFCLFLWPVALTVHFLSSRPGRLSPWGRLVNWVMPKEDK